jgi:hypothetical protein
VTADLFETFGESLIPAPVKYARAAAERREAKKAARAAIPPMVKRGLELKQEQTKKQLQRYKKWKAEVREGMSRGDYGSEIVDMFKVLRKRSSILEYVRASPWLLACSVEVKLTLLGYIDHSLIRYDVRAGYPPFNDSLPHEPDTPFIEIRRLLMGT